MTIHRTPPAVLTVGLQSNYCAKQYLLWADTQLQGSHLQARRPPFKSEENTIKYRADLNKGYHEMQTHTCEAQTKA